MTEHRPQSHSWQHNNKPKMCQQMASRFKITNHQNQETEHIGYCGKPITVHPTKEDTKQERLHTDNTSGKYQILDHVM